MKIAFHFDYGLKTEIGFGHVYRSYELGRILEKRKHKVEYIEDDVLLNDTDVLVIDHVFSQKSMIDRALSANIKTVLVDGAEEDVDWVDCSVSAFFNPKAEYTGFDYIVIPRCFGISKYNVQKKNKDVFVALGGFDKNDYYKLVLDVLGEMGLSAVVAKSKNHPNLKMKYKNVGVYEGDDYCEPMSECKLAITNAGLSAMQSIHFGLPSVLLPQYKHQERNASYFEHCSIPLKMSEVNKENLKEKISRLYDNEYLRQSLSTLAKYCINGGGGEKVADLIEGL